MIKVIVILLVGAAAGYWFGYADARQHRQHIVARAVAGVAEWQRPHFTNAVDKVIDSVGR